jgi:hypothetical protein
MIEPTESAGAEPHDRQPLSFSASSARWQSLWVPINRFPPSDRVFGTHTFKAALASDGIPFTSFAVDDVHKEFERLRALGVEFTQEPAAMGSCQHRRLRRHVRKPDPDRADKVRGPVPKTGRAGIPGTGQRTFHLDRCGRR